MVVIIHVRLGSLSGAMCNECATERACDETDDMATELPIPDSTDVLVLHQSGSPSDHVASISRRAADGEVVWTVEPPVRSTGDAWVAVRIEGTSVLANTYSCYLVALDLVTGEELSRKFTK